MIKKALGTALLFYLSVTMMGCSSPVANKDFSADFMSRSGSVSFKGKMFFSGDKFRMENPQAVTITRMDKKAVWVLMPSQKMYMEQPMTEDHAKGVAQKMEGEIKREKVGSETVNGIKADKYRVTYKTDGSSGSIFQWTASGLSMPVKTSSVDGKWSMELKNIKFGSQPASLFEIPAGYKKFSYNIPSF